MNATTTLRPTRPTRTESPDDIHERIVDTLVCWRKKMDELSKPTAEARLAIKEARELEIWKVKGYGNFQDWLRDECDITRQWAHALIKSAQSIAQIEEAAESNKSLAPLLKGKTAETLRALPDRQVKRLSKLPPKKAAKAALSAIQEAGGKIPSEKAVQEAVEKLAPKEKPEVNGNGKSEKTPESKVLLALDTEWQKLKNEMAYMSSVKPVVIYNRLRAAVAKAL